jgi:hypothetical protein
MTWMRRFASKGGVGAGMSQPPEQPAVSVDFMPPPVPVDESREQKEALVRLLDDEEVRERRRREEEEERLFREFLANEYKCQACGRSADPETLFAATCEHVCCAACLLLHARTLIAANPTQRVPVTCIRPQCERAGTFTDGVLMVLSRGGSSGSCVYRNGCRKGRALHRSDARSGYCLRRSSMRT